MAGLPVAGAVCLQLLPLLRRQLAANGEQEARIRLFELSAGLGDLVDLGQDLAFVGLVFAHHRLEFEFRLLHRGAKVDELLAMLQERFVHSLALCVGQLQLRYELGIVPPLSMIAVRSEGSFKRRPMVSKSRAVARAATGPLCQRQRRSGHCDACNRYCKSYCHPRLHCAFLLRYVVSVLLLEISVDCVCLPGSCLPGFVVGHQPRQRFHGAGNFPRYIAIHIG